jgi:hypothetical protein
MALSGSLCVCERERDRESFDFLLNESRGVAFYTNHSGLAKLVYCRRVVTSQGLSESAF